ncbi:hypothetical protein AAG570_008831 [Ranatra chinensis]|uniref:Uncharacterized protein n=1 Tax=Ranatra chinensis TaxID=642074 RepID=A0ABD0YU72_9HEMI
MAYQNKKQETTKIVRTSMSDDDTISAGFSSKIFRVAKRCFRIGLIYPSQALIACPQAASNGRGRKMQVLFRAVEDAQRVLQVLVSARYTKGTTAAHPRKCPGHRPRTKPINEFKSIYKNPSIRLITIMDPIRRKIPTAIKWSGTKGTRLASQPTGEDETSSAESDEDFVRISHRQSTGPNYHPSRDGWRVWEDTPNDDFQEINREIVKAMEERRENFPGAKKEHTLKIL